MDTYIRKGAARRLADGALSVLMALITPLLEKNPAKALATPAGAFVFSMSRLIVLAFAAAMLRQVWHAGVAGWPDATLAIAIVLALPLLGALDRASPEQVPSSAASASAKRALPAGPITASPIASTTIDSARAASDA